MNSKICGHCKWIKDVNGSWQCNNPANCRYRDGVAYTYSPCEVYDESTHAGQKALVDKGDDPDVTVADVSVVSDQDAAQIKRSITEDVEQISKNVVIGRKEARYEDGRNVISVIINAISVRINMPRGTVKALLACLAVLLIAVILLTVNGKDSGSTVDNSTDVTSDTETQREYAEDEESKAVNSERPASEDYVIISSRYRYSLPDGFEGIWEPYDYYEQNETFCDFTYDGVPFTARSYLLQYVNKDLADIVKASLSQFDGIEFLNEEYIEGKYGKVLKIRFEVTDEDGTFSAVTGYYWSDIDPYVCCLEVFSDSWHGEEAAEMILDSVYRTDSSESSNPVPDNAQEALNEQMKEEAMDSLAQDAMNDYYQQQEPENYPW